MIRYVRGILRELREGMVLVEAGGLGYGIRVPASLLPALPPPGEEVKIHTYFSVREDAMELFGFLTAEDRDIFVRLLGVSGIGPKGALGILSVLRPEELRRAIFSGDTRSIQAAPGIGKKTAERLILDLKDKIDPPDFLPASSDGEIPEGGEEALRDSAKEALEALLSLGYGMAEAQRAVRRVKLTEDMTPDDVLKQSLRHLAF